MANDLRIRIAATLNTGVVSVKEINASIREIEQKIKRLKISVDIDKSAISTLKDFNVQMQKMNKSSINAMKSFSGMNKEYSDQERAIQSLLRQQERRAKKIQEETIGLSEQKRTVNELTKGYTELNKQIRKTGSGEISGITTTYKNEQGNGRVIRSDASGNVIDYKDIKNIEKFRVEQDRLVQSLTNVFNQGKINEQQFNKFNNSINSSKNITELEKLQVKLKETTATSDNALLQKRLVSDAQNLLRTHGNTVDRKGVSNLITELNGITPSAKNASNSLKNVQLQLRNYSNEAREAARSSMTIMDAFQTAMVNFAVYSGNIIDY